jgi:hypothetical protein
MVTVPPLIPVTTPVDDTVAFVALLLLHVPPGVASASDIVLPWHTTDEPVIAAGGVPTVTIAEAAQPLDSVYTTVAVPAPKGLTTPSALIVATVAGAMDHVPPATELPRVVVPPAQTARPPVMAPGAGFTISVSV